MAENVKGTAMRSRAIRRFGLGLAIVAGATWALVAAFKPPIEPITLSFAETAVFRGPHEHVIGAVAFSADGKTLATGAQDGRLRIWDAVTGRLQSIHFDDAVRGISGLAMAPDGRFVAVCGAIFGREAVVWDVTSGKIALEIEDDAAPASAHEAMIYKGQPIAYRVQTALAWSPDGRWLATCGDEVTVREAESGKPHAALEHDGSRVLAMVFSADGQMLATAAEDGRVRLWSVHDGALQSTLQGGKQPATGVALSADGRRIVATTSGPRSLLSQEQVGNLWVWDGLQGEPRKFELGNVNARGVAMLSPTSVVVAAGHDVLVVDLEAASSAGIRKLSTHGEPVEAVAASPDGRLVASGGKDRTVDAVNAQSGELVYRLPGLVDDFTAIRTSSDGKCFAAATSDRRFSNRMPGAKPTFDERYAQYFSGANKERLQAGEVRVWRADNGQLQTLVAVPVCQVTAIDFVAGTDWIAVGGWKPAKGGMLSLWSAVDGKPVRDLPVGTAAVTAVAVSSDGKLLLSGDADGNIETWEVATGNKLWSHRHGQAIEALAFGRSGRRFVMVDANRAVQLREAGSSQVVLPLESPTQVESLAISPDERWFAAGARGPGLVLWDLMEGEEPRTLVAPGDHFDTMPGFVAFSPDGRFVVCGGHGKDIAVFEVTTGKLFKELRGHAHAPTAAAFLPDGRLVSGGEERSLKLWDVAAGKCLATWIAVPADERQEWSDQWVAFRPDGQFIGSENLDRLAGWLSGGEAYVGAEDGKGHRRVETLFGDEAGAP